MVGEQGEVEEKSVVSPAGIVVEREGEQGEERAIFPRCAPTKESDHPGGLSAPLVTTRKRLVAASPPPFLKVEAEEDDSEAGDEEEELAEADRCRSDRAKDERGRRTNGIHAPETTAEEVAHLRASLAAAEERASRAEARLGMWEELTRTVTFIMALGPESTEYYRRTLVHEVVAGLRSVEQIKEIKNIDCSFPAVRSAAPRLRLVNASGDLTEPMIWDVQWTSPSWAISLSVRGSHFGLGFSLNLRLHNMGLKGRLKVSLVRGREFDLSQVLISFVEPPDATFTLDSNVGFGLVPLPVSRLVDSKLRLSLAAWLAAHVVEPNQMPFSFDSLGPKKVLSDEDVKQAIMDAESVRRRASSGGFFSPVYVSSFQ